MSKRPAVTIRCVADRYASPGERIVEVHSAAVQKGCLISVREMRRTNMSFTCPSGEDGCRIEECEVQS